MVDHPPGIYMDHASATPIDPRVRAVMAPFLTEAFGNPESVHEWARPAAAAIELARAHVAALLDVEDDGVIFTSGDTEARNLAVKGIWSANRHRGGHIVATTVEHPAVLAACRSVTRAGGELTLVGVDGEGRPTPRAIAQAVRDDTVLVTVPHAQPEIGTVLDVAAIGAAVRARAPEVAFHVDAGATAGLLPLDPDGWGCDAVSLGGGSLFGPRWAGALWVRPGTRLHPLIDGGLQEGGKRAGAHDVPAIVGLGEAARLALAEQAARVATMRAMAERLTLALEATDGVQLNGSRQARIPGHVQVSVDGVEGEALTLLMAAAGVGCAPGSPCSAAGKASGVLEAIGQTAPRSHSSVLFTLAPSTTAVEVDRAAAVFADAVARLRALHPTPAA